MAVNMNSEEETIKGSMEPRSGNLQDSIRYFPGSMAKTCCTLSGLPDGIQAKHGPGRQDGCVTQVIQHFWG